jgi:16S rRNA processing protein RimM
VPRDRLPEPEDGEVYLHDLIGLNVMLSDGSKLGEVVNVENYGAGDLIDVKVDGRKDSVLIPFAEQFVVSVGDDRLVVDLPEGYLDREERP